MEEGRDPEPLGWDAIDKAFEKIYGDQEPMHYAAMIKYWMGGPDPLDGISVFRSDNGVPHWHYVSYGFTELYEKEGDNPEYSGYGFELTMRLLRSPDEEVPQWPLSLMQNFARYVFESGNIFEAGHYLDCNGPVALEIRARCRPGRRSCCADGEAGRRCVDQRFTGSEARASAQYAPCSIFQHGAIDAVSHSL